MNIKHTLHVGDQKYIYYRLKSLEEEGKGQISVLPFSIKILLESALRQADGKYITKKHIEQLAGWETMQWKKKEVPFKPARILFQDYTGIPAIVDLASMRNAVQQAGGDASAILPQIPVDLVIDHSLIVDHSGNKQSFRDNLKLEYARNLERYRFVRWAQKSFAQFRVVPPANGIVHQVNLEFLANSVMTRNVNGSVELYPDSLVGTDSHTPMINSLGIVGWGVGGIEAEAAMLGQPLYFVIPEVVGFKFTGELPEGTTATDLALTVTHILRKKGVVDKFIEFYGSGLKHISLADRATIANMAPEYGATMSFFPTDEVTIDYLRMTGRGDKVPLAEAYYKAQGLFRSDETPEPKFTEVLELDLSTIKPVLAGPKRPQDRIELSNMKQAFAENICRPIVERGYGLAGVELGKKIVLKNSEGTAIGTGSIVLAAITSCTNTSNPYVMIAAGLVAKKAIERGLKKPAYVKSSLTPGSKVVTQYLQRAGLLAAFEQLGFFIDGYGCAACCGNSGALSREVEEAIKDNQLLVASVISGNRNFEGRVHPLIKANYLGSPPLVVAYALAGTVQIDLTKEPLGYGFDDQPIYLKDIWPTSHEIQEFITSTINTELFQSQYKDVFHHENWSSIEAPEGLLYSWDNRSTYIQEAPYFKEGRQQENVLGHLQGMKVLLFLGDSITTDHISPVGQIGAASPAGLYLTDRGVAVEEFNSYGTRRGNHQVMMRGTFANLRIRNALSDGREGGYTKYLPTGEIMTVYDAAMKYKEDHTHLLIIAGKEYGTGSSRDWAAKGTSLLGVKAVLAESFERIHRSNLVGMGVLPLQFREGENALSLHLTGTETYELIDIDDKIEPRQIMKIQARRPDGSNTQFQAILRLDSLIEIEYYLHGGILQTVMNYLFVKKL